MYRRRQSLIRKCLLILSLPSAGLLCLGTDCTAVTQRDISVRPPTFDPQPKVRIETSLGNIVIELFNQQAPVTVDNFLTYVKEGFYRKTIFHFASASGAVAGTYASDLNARTVHDPIANESNNGLSNTRGRVGLVEPDGDGTGTSQFVINLADNKTLDYDPVKNVKGQPVFGRVVEGLDIADKIGALSTHQATAGDGKTLSNLPNDPPVIQHVFLLNEDGSINTDEQPSAVNRAPVAKAERDHKTAAGIKVTLDGNGSTDPDFDDLTFAWAQTTGVSVTLSDTTVAQPTFIAPAGPNHLEFTLTVTDEAGLTATDSVAIDIVASPNVRLATIKGDIVFQMLVSGAPISTSNFMQYVEDRFYDGTIFHRVVNTPTPFVIQGGGFFPDLSQPNGLRDPIQNEFGADRSNIRSTVAMAKLGNDPNSATSQFFVNLSDDNAGLPGCDPKTDPPCLDNQNGGFTVFARVIAGMDVVDQIAAVPTSTQKNPDGQDFTDVPVDPILVNSATIEEGAP
jgi:cyclophilin family peptidyl-prolyl cis-trans isomerase